MLLDAEIKTTFFSVSIRTPSARMGQLSRDLRSVFNAGFYTRIGAAYIYSIYCTNTRWFTK